MHRNPMLRLVVFVGVFAFSLAAAPRQLAQARAGGKRQEGQAQVIIVTYFNYVASMSSFQLWLVRSNVERLEESHDIFYDPQLIDVKAANIDGMFGAVYNIQGVNCDKLNNFITAIKGLSSLTKQVTMKCGGKTKTVA